MSLETFIQEYRPAIEDQLRQVIATTRRPGLDELHTMLAYHMGWEGAGSGPEASGKRIRPLMVVLTCLAAGGRGSAALPAAAAVELVHNFSLIHDDIEDNSPLRHGRATVWKLWGIPQAINAGDALFTLAHLALLELEGALPPAAVLEAMHLLDETCLHLTQGQYLDISYEARGNLSLEAYWPMVSGKTAALLSTCCELGALSAQAPNEVRQAYRHFGRALGLAFQAQDDLLGIWGDAALTGKSADSDLLSGKKSLPVLYGLAQNGQFARRWAQGAIQPGEVRHLAEALKDEGAYTYTQEKAGALTDEALQALAEAHPHGEAGAALQALAFMLLKRQG